MAQYVFEETIRVYWSSVDLDAADLSEVTLAEISAATEITDFLTKDGFQPGVTNNRVPAGHLGTSFDGEIMGSWGSGLTLVVLRDDESDTGFDTLGVRGTRGTVIAVPNGSGTGGAPADGDGAMIWQVELGTPVPNNSAANERQTATIECAASAANLNAAVAAGS